MRDIVERLKETAIMLPRSGYVSVGHEAKEAADEITALRARLAEVEKERNALLGWRTVAESNQAMAQSWQARAERAEAEAATARRDAVKIKSDAINDFCAKAGIAMSVEVKAIPEDVREFRRENAFRALKDTLPQPPRDV